MRTLSKNIAIPGVVGSIEAIIDSRESGDEPYVAICCHPHPQHSGTMTNKVIHTASKALSGLGVTSIRFNFRGVGKSDGNYADGVGEQDDLVAVHNWVKMQYPDRKLLLVGFSFGAYISALQARNLEPELLISIAPPIGRIEFDGYEPPECPWIIIQGEQDELVEASAVYSWAARFEKTPQITKMAETSHFFHGKLLDLRGVIESFCSQELRLT